jgi:hypothetical protein
MKTLYESVLADMENTLTTGDKIADDMSIMHKYHPLLTIAGVSDNVEKLFTNKLDEFAQVAWYSERMEMTERKYGASRWFYCRNFGKLLERLSDKELGMSLYVSKMQDAEKLAAAIEAYVKKEGYLKKTKNIRIVGRYYDDNGNYFTKGQLQIEVQKVDKDGNVVKTKNGSVAVMYLFDCK